MTTLTPVEEQILRLRREGCDLLGTAKRLGLTRIEVRRIERKALAKLRAGRPS
jgi:DNA-directed RNA polymerase sigma subunit (sigma70/sigma32)